MTRSLVYLSLWFAVPAWAANVAKTSPCGEHGLIGTSALPSFEAIKAVSPEDEVAILAFIASVVPLPSGKTLGDLERVLIAFWSRFRPDLSADQIHARVYANAPSSQGLHTLRAPDEIKKRPEVGRLRLMWMNFIADVVPDAPDPDLTIKHRAEVLALNQKAHIVIDFLDRSFGPEVRLQDDSPAKALRYLYETYLPQHELPDFELKGTNNWDRGLELVAYWRGYVDASASRAPVKIVASRKNTTHFEYDLDPTADPSTVPNDPRAIVEYLILRYPDIEWQELRGIFKLVEALRNDWSLDTSLIDIPESAAKAIMRHKNWRPMGERLTLIWEEFLEDREKMLNAK